MPFVREDPTRDSGRRSVFPDPERNKEWENGTFSEDPTIQRPLFCCVQQYMAGQKSDSGP